MKNTKMAMMGCAGRVLILVENLSVPFDQRVWREASTLTEGGYKVSVICPKGTNYDTRRHEIINDVSVHRYKAYEANSGLLSYMFEYSQAIVKMMLLSIVVFFKEGLDVIQICNPPDLLFLVTLPYKILGKKVIFDHHDLSPETYLSKKKNQGLDFVYKILLLLESLSFKGADVIMSTNESYKTIAMSRGKVKERNIFVVRNGPDLERVKFVRKEPNLRNGKRYLVLYVGTMGPQDGVDYLLRSIHYLVYNRKRHDFHVLIIGGGIELENLKHYAHELRIGDMLAFTGRVPDKDVVEALSTADVCVCPDPNTPLNNISTMNKTLEYMAVGKPIVSFDLEETKFSAGDAALYAIPNDEKDFAEKISTLLDSQEQRKRCGQIGKDRILNGLSWEYSKKHLYAAYDLALKMGR